MTYSTGNVILASDYNGFVGNVSANCINQIWSTGSGDSGWGQTALANVSAAATVTATQWATIVTNLITLGNQSNVAITSRTAPTAGNTISILANVQTDINNITASRGNAQLSGTEYGTFTGNVSKTAATGSGTQPWTITWTHTITFPDANSARYFWNAGGIVRIKYGKSSTGTDHDPDWNTLASTWAGSINITGRCGNVAATIAGQPYTGTTRLGGAGGTQTTLTTTTGWYQLTSSPVTIFQLNNATAPYQPEYIRTTATQTSSTVLTLVTTWVDDGTSAAGTTSNISGGTATTSPSTTITGTAPTTLVTYIPPSTSYLTNTWGTPTIAATVA